MYCGFCGKQFPDGAAFCPHCGRPAGEDGRLAALAEQARTGDQNAVAALYEATYDKVYYTVKSMIRDEDTVFDIVQDTYLKAFTHLDQFRAGTSFPAWVKQIAANTARDWLKKKKPMLFSEMGDADTPEAGFETQILEERSANLPDVVLDEAETKRLIREIIDALPDDQRAAIGMFYYEEMSVKEIAAAMGASEAAVKSRLMYGRRKIEKQVEDLEKKGTKLYGLTPMPFLLLLFGNEKTKAFDRPDARILQNVLQQTARVSHTAASATASGSASAAAKTAAAAGTKATGMSLGAKAAIALLSLAIVVGGAFGVSAIVNRDKSPKEPAAQQTAQAESPAEATPEASAEPEEAPLDAALAAYREIIEDREIYDFGVDASEPIKGYRYAIETIQKGDPVPTLLLEKMTEFGIGYVRLFQYVPETGGMYDPGTPINEGVGQVGGFRGSLSILGDGSGLLAGYWSSGTGEGEELRMTLNRDAITEETLYTGNIMQAPQRDFREIQWHDVGDDAGFARWSGENAQSTDAQAAEPSPTPIGNELDAKIQQARNDGNYVLTGTINDYGYDQVVALQGQPDPNAAYSSYIKDKTWHIFVLDTPQQLTGHSGDGMGSVTHEARMIVLGDGYTAYNGQHVTISVSQDDLWFPSDTSMPLGEPSASITVLG